MVTPVKIDGEGKVVSVEVIFTFVIVEVNSDLKFFRKFTF